MQKPYFGTSNDECGDAHVNLLQIQTLLRIFFFSKGNRASKNKQEFPFPLTVAFLKHLRVLI